MAGRLIISQLALPASDTSKLTAWLQAETASVDGDVVFCAENDGVRSYCVTQPYRPLAVERLAPPIDGASRYICAEVSDTGSSKESATVTQVVAFDVPLPWRDEIDAWYRNEHIGLLMQADGWLRARRYSVEQTLAGRPFTSIALHDLRNAAVMHAPERAAARTTPWRGRFSSEPWFENSGRWLYRRMFRGELA